MKPSEITIALPELFAAKRSPFIWGKSGVGKSSVVHQVAKAMRLELRDVRMSQLDSIDLRGFPMPDAKTGTMKWLSPDFLPTKADKPGILFLDEMNGAMPAVLAPSYQLILDRRIGNYVFPDHWHIVAAGNGLGDRGITHSMPAPLNNRFTHIDYDVDADDWHKRAMDDGIDLTIRAYHRLKAGSTLHVFDSAANPRAFPTPRAWYAVHDLLQRQLPPGILLSLVQGTVGEGAGAEFIGFRNDIVNMPDIDAIILNPDKADLPKTQSIMHAVVTALVDKAKASTMDRLMKYVERLQRDIQVVFVRMAIAKDQRVTSTKSYKDWGIKNQGIIT